MERSQQLRQRRDVSRREQGPNGTGKEGESIVDLKPATTIAAILFLLAVGASLASSYILYYRPNCIKVVDTVSLNTNLNDSEQPRLKQVPNRSTITEGSVVSAPQEDDTMPATCTADQVEAIKRQLVPNGCTGTRPWTQSCSWTHATRGCQDHHWMNEVYSKIPFGSDPHNKPFVAIFVGWGHETSKAGFVLNALQLGSHDVKYDVTKFEGTGCPKKAISFDGTTKGTGTKVYVLENQKERMSAIEKMKEDFNAGDELVIQSKDFVTDPVMNTLDKWSEHNLPTGDDPVHQLSINVQGEDFAILMGASNLLKRTRYIDFEVNWMGSWQQSSLSILIRKLKARGFVCYFTGDDMLWRVTDCWLNHYGEKNWGRLACVNAHHPDVKGVLDRMEMGFLETLKKQIKFAS